MSWYHPFTGYLVGFTVVILFFQAFFLPRRLENNPTFWKINGAFWSGIAFLWISWALCDLRFRGIAYFLQNYPEWSRLVLLTPMTALLAYASFRVAGNAKRQYRLA